MPDHRVDATAARRTATPPRTAPPEATPRPTARRDKPVWIFVDLAPIYGGHEIMVLRWIEALQQQGDVEPVLICAAGSRLSEVGPSQVRTVPVQLAEGSLVDKLKRFANMLRTFRALKRELRPALTVVAEGCLMSQRHGLFAAFMLRMRTVLYVPLVSSFTEMGLPDAERLDRKMLGYYRKLPAAWLTITPQQADELRRWTGIEQPVFTLPNTVAPKFETATGARPARPGPSRALVLGRLDAHQKGLDLLLEHLQSHPEVAEVARVSFVGEGPYLPTLEAALHDDPSLGDRISLDGWQDAAESFASHDVLLMTSRFEGVPLVMLEAMAAGVPVVATDLPGTRPYLPASCLFPFGDLARAFEAVRALRDDPALRAEVVEHNLRSFVQKASPAAFEMGVRRLTGELAALTAA